MTTNRMDNARSQAAVVVSLLALVSAALVVVGLAGTAKANVLVVKGSAFGYWSHDISLFGGSQPDRGPAPSETLAFDASNSPSTAIAPCGYVNYGPAWLFTSDALQVTSTGSVGGGGSVTSSSSITNINKATDSACLVDTNQDGVPDGPITNWTGKEIFTADGLRGSVTASETGITASTTIINGTYDEHSNTTNNCSSVATPCGGHVHDPLNPDGKTPIPTNPPPNYKVAGHVHLSDQWTDYFVIVFNEQISNPDGSLTVNPVHEYFGSKLDSNGNIVEDPPYPNGSILHGHLYLGQVTAGITSDGLTTTTTSSTTTSSTTTTTLPSADVSALTTGPRQAQLNRVSVISGGATNFGPSTATNLSFTVTFPSTLTIADVMTPTGAVCAPPLGHTYTCTVSSLEPGSTAAVKAMGSFTAPGEAVTEVSVTPIAPPDPNSSNNHASLRTTVN